MKFLIILLFTVSIATQDLSAQSDVMTPSGRRSRRTIKEINDADFERRRLAMSVLGNQKPELKRKSKKTLTKAERKRLKEVTRVHKEDLVKYKSFLKQSKTGIFRILPDFGCETKQLIKIDGDCSNFVPGRWAYSFRRKAYGGEDFHDIIFKKDSFKIDSLLTQGILVSLGSLSLDNVSLESPQLNYLTTFKPEADKHAVGKQFKALSSGIKKDGYTYSNKALVKENTTYAFRVIAYRFKDKWTSRLWRKNIAKATKEERKFYWITFDKRNDSIFVFRVIRKSEDGIITVLWKRLMKQKAPTLVYEKDEKLLNIKELAKRK